MKNFYYFNQNYYFKKDKCSPTPLKNTEFTAIGIGTQSKGPLYAIVRGDGKISTKDVQGCKIQMNYHIDDTPIDDALSFVTYADYSGVSPYELYPLILQIMNINEFLENQCSDDTRIYLNQLYVTARSEDQFLGEEFSDKKLRKMIDKYGLMTDMGGFVGDKSFLTIYANKRKSQYEITEDVPSFTSFGDFMMLCFPEIETGFMVRDHVYNQLLNLNEASIIVRHTNKVEKITDLKQSIIDTNSYHSMKTYTALTIDQIIKLFIYVPQIIRIERSLFDVDTTIDVILEARGKKVDLTIRKEEYSVDLSLFDVFCSLLHLLSVTG